METVSDYHTRIVGGSRSWRATPEEYNSLRTLWLEPQGDGELIYGFGQIIYAKIRCLWKIDSAGTLSLKYVESPAFQVFKGYRPEPDTATKDISYSLVEEASSFTISIVGRKVGFSWTLRFDRSPFPDELKFPYDVPRVYYGYAEGEG